MKSPSLPWEMESPQTRILTVFMSEFEATAEDGGELLSVAGSGSARPLVRGAAIMAMMAERNAEARILPRQTGSRLMSYITSTWLGSQYARKWAISTSIFVDMWEKRIERDLGTAAFLLWVFFGCQQRGGGRGLARCY